MIRTGLPAAGVIVNSLGRDEALFEVLIVGADDLAFCFGFLAGGRLFVMVFSASLWKAEWFVRIRDLRRRQLRRTAPTPDPPAAQTRGTNTAQGGCPGTTCRSVLQ